MDQTVVTATSGRTLGTRPARRLRAEGKLPGVVYGLGKEPVPVAVDYAELRDALKGESGMNTVLSLDLGGQSETVIVRSVQRDPLKRVVTHADFLRVDPEVRIRVKVPVKLVGDGSGVTNYGGMIEQKLFELEVEVLPTEIPAEIEADLSIMTLDRRIGVEDLQLPPGVTTSVPGDISVVTPVISRAAKMAARGIIIDEDEELGIVSAPSEDAGGDDAEPGDNAGAAGSEGASEGAGE
jgi:large subunit ribosomal protein L25